MTQRVVQVEAFADRPFAGNPAAVCVMDRPREEQWDGAKAYTRIGGIIYLVLAILGFVAEDGFGIVPLGGNDIWLHLVLGLVLAGVGFTARPVGANS